MNTRAVSVSRRRRACPDALRGARDGATTSGGRSATVGLLLTGNVSELRRDALVRSSLEPDEALLEATDKVSFGPAPAMAAVVGLRVFLL